MESMVDKAKTKSIHFSRRADDLLDWESDGWWVVGVLTWKLNLNSVIISSIDICLSWGDEEVMAYVSVRLIWVSVSEKVEWSLGSASNVR